MDIMELHQELQKLQVEVDSKEKLSIDQIVNMSNRLAELQQIKRDIQGDTVQALLVLVNRGIIPVSELPRFLKDLEKK